MEGIVQGRLAAAASSAACRWVRHTLVGCLLERRIHARDASTAKRQDFHPPPLRKPALIEPQISRDDTSPGVANNRLSDGGNTKHWEIAYLRKLSSSITLLTLRNS